MRRILAIVLLFVVSFQSAWAAAASYCTDGDDGRDFGHHVHVHMGAGDTPSNAKPVDHKPAGNMPAHPDADCLACHIAAMNAIVVDLPALAQASVATLRFEPVRADFESGPAALPERPNWRDLA